MIYADTINVSPNTFTSLPSITPLRVTEGFVYKVEVDFPPGSAGLLRVWITDGSFQVWPSDPGRMFRGDGICISFEDSYLKSSEPFEFSIFAINLDDTWYHDFSVRIGLVSKDIFMARFLPTYGYEYFRKLLEQMEVEQRTRLEAEREDLLRQPFPWIEP